MTDKKPYSYVVLRYVHDVLTGECLNVGLVMAMHDGSPPLTRAKRTFGRIKGAFPDLDSDAFKRAISAVERALEQVRKNSANEGLLFKPHHSAQELSRLALPLDDSSLQWSPMGTGITDDPKKTFDQLYQRFVSRYDKPADKRKSDDDVWRLVASQLKVREVPITLEPKRVQGETDAVDFKHAWKNGRWHAYEPVSFDLADADGIKDKARRWLGHLTAVGSAGTEDVQVHFIVGKPQRKDLQSAYRAALGILERVPFENRVFEEDAIDEVVRQIEDEVRNHLTN